MPTITPTQGADTSGPNASLPFGQATQEKQLQRQAGMFAHGGQTQPGAPPTQPQMGGQPPPGGAPGGAPGGGLPGMPGGAGSGPGQEQAPPVQPLTEKDMAPGGPIFMQPQTSTPPSWRQQLRVWAEHPDSNLIRRLSQRADAGLPPAHKAE